MILTTGKNREMISKVDKVLIRLTREKTHIINIISEAGDITTAPTHIKR